MLLVVVPQLFILLKNIEIKTEADVQKPSTRKKATKAVPVTNKKPTKQDKKLDPVAQAHTKQSISSSPSLHIDLQIHISPDASAEQIDKIFASMSKHLYNQK